MSVNPWEILLTVLGWTALMITALVILVLVLGGINSALQGIKKRRYRKTHVAELSDEAIMELAVDRSETMYYGSIIIDTEKANAFQDGAAFALSTKRGIKC